MNKTIISFSVSSVNFVYKDDLPIIYSSLVNKAFLQELEFKLLISNNGLLVNWNSCVFHSSIQVVDAFKAAFTHQTKVGKLVLANSSWCVWTTQQQLANMLANCWWQIELVSILANFFINFDVLVNSIWRVNDWQTCVANFQPIKIRALFTWFAWHFTKWRTSDRTSAPSDRLSVKRCLNLLTRFTIIYCPALSPRYKDTKNKQKKMELEQIGMCCDFNDACLTCEGTSLPTFLSLPTRVCQL